METEPLFDADQQTDMRELLEFLNAYFQETSAEFKDSKVLIGPHASCIVLHLGAPLERDDDMALQDLRSRRTAAIREVFYEFYREFYTNARSGPALMQQPNLIKDEDYIVPYKLIPNDPRGAMGDLKRVTKRLRERHSNAKA